MSGKRILALFDVDGTLTAPRKVRTVVVARRSPVQQREWRAENKGGANRSLNFLPPLDTRAPSPLQIRHPIDHSTPIP